MRRAITYGVLFCLAVSWASTAWAAQPAEQAAPSQITSPAPNTPVRGTVPIVGSAIDAQFWKYELSYAPEPNPRDQWTLIGSVHETQVTNGLLETWDTTIIPDRTYTLRLRVVNRTGNYVEIYARNVLVANAAPTETPLPTDTPLPPATATTAATPTFIIPSSPLSQPTATPTLSRPTGSALPEAVDLSAWRQSFCLGAQIMAAVLVAIALIFLLRRLL